MPHKQPRRVAGLILDIDGTLLDSNDAHAHAWQDAFREFEKDFPYKLVRSQIGKGGDLLVPDLLNAREVRLFGQKVTRRRTEIFRREYLPTLKPFPKIRQSLEILRARKIKLALASSADPDDAKAFLKILGIGDLIEGTTTADDAEHSKPYPEIFEAALQLIGTPKIRTGAVGDTPYDILAAHRMALPLFAVRCGGFEEELLARAELVFADVPDLVRRINQIDEYFAES